MKKEWSTACLDWETRIINSKPLVTCPVLFPETADYAMEIFKQLKIVDMIGRPEIGEVTRQWVYDFASVFFGSLDEENNVRLIKEFMLLVSKKNTKSTISAGLMLTVLILNVRDSAEFLILAPTVEAANNAFNPARDMVNADDELKSIFHIQEHIRTITHRGTRAKLKVVAAESDALAGNKATGVLIDELWLFGKNKKAAAMFTEATGGLMSRPEGFVIYLTTQSDESPAGVFKERLNYARNVRDGEINDNQFLPVLYEFPEEYIKKKLYLKPENFYITNPNLGASVDEAFLTRKITSAIEGGDESYQQVLSKHLNVQIGTSLRDDRWAGAEFWDQCGDSSLTFDEIIERSEVIDIGIDGGGLDDLLGLSVIGRERDTGQWLVWAHAWAHPSVLNRRQEIAPRLIDFSRMKQLTLVSRTGEDVVAVAEVISRVYEAGLLDFIGVDSAGISDVLDECEKKGIPKDLIVAVPQGWKLGSAIKNLERKLEGQKLIHCAHELMQWCVGNAKIEQRANGILITKQASGTAKIDPLIAVIIASYLMSLNPETKTKDLVMGFV